MNDRTLAIAGIICGIFVTLVLLFLVIRMYLPSARRVVNPGGGSGAGQIQPTNRQIATGYDLALPNHLIVSNLRVSAKE